MKRDFQPGDLVGFQDKNHYQKDKYIYGVVTSVVDTELGVESVDYFWDFRILPQTDVDYYPPIYLDDDKVSQFARYEISFQELVDDFYPPQRLRTRELYHLSIDDLLCALKNASAVSRDQFKEEWFHPIWYVMKYTISYGKHHLLRGGDEGYRFLPSKGYPIWKAMDTLDDMLNEDAVDYPAIIEKLEFWKELFRLPVAQRPYPVFHKSCYISNFDSNEMLNTATEAELALFVSFVEELCEKNEATALRAKAYGCYGGNRAFPCDWTASRDALLKLYELEGDPFVANSLGYIYYYGRCSDSAPDYENAFKFFSIGAAGGVYESRYKLADMFLNGFGVHQNNQIASNLIWQVYHESKYPIFDGDFRSKFADAALRAGNLVRDDFDHVMTYANRALYYYFQADFAIRMRMLTEDDYGDDKVAAKIRQTIEETLPGSDYAEPKKTVSYFTLEHILTDCCKGSRQFELKLKKTKNGEFSLKCRVRPRKDEKYPPKLFITEPEAHFCGLCDSLSAKTQGFKKLYIRNKVFRGDSAIIIFDSVEEDGFFLYGEKVAEIICDRYRVSYKSKEKRLKKHFVTVAYHNREEKDDYICDIPDVAVGDSVIVEIFSKETAVKVKRVFDKDETETALPISKYKAVLRKA